MREINLKNRLAAGDLLVMDGGMGSELERRSIPTTLPLWSAEALLTHPEAVEQIHKDYIDAGAELIITDTFRTTRRAFGKRDMADQAASAAALACSLAQHAREKTHSTHELYMAGSIAPLEDCYTPELTPSQPEIEAEHAELVAQLKLGGVDFILLETMITARETLSGVKTAYNSGLPFAVSFCCNDALALLGSEPLQEVVQAVEPFQPLFVGVNCISSEIATRAVKQLRAMTTLPISVYAQGYGPAHDLLAEEHHLQTYLRAALQWLDAGAQIIGGCCGTTPAHIRALRHLLDTQA
ncbi:MAG TPA: homocysteine S-methyltransferase family protein [Ktedonobacteraceae bacterium]|jgi:homocysteine S-methyltransferase